MEIDEYLLTSELIEENDKYKKYKINCQDGYGYMTSYQPLEGIWVVINDFHCFLSPESLPSSKRYLEINHCLNGRYECIFDGNRYAYLGEGDLSISDWSISTKVSSFPLGYYYGIEILIDIDKICQSSFFKQFHINIDELFIKVNEHNKLLIARSTKRIDNIFWEMYQDHDIWKIDYLKIKVVELLYYLIASSFKEDTQKQYYTRFQIKTVKKIKKYLEENYTEKFTIQSIADQFDINITALRNCFKDIYGKPIYKWHKEYRLQVAKKLLENTNLPIIEIALQVGYDNPSKFSAAFSKQFHITPLQYRKTF